MQITNLSKMAFGTLISRANSGSIEAQRIVKNLESRGLIDLKSFVEAPAAVKRSNLIFDLIKEQLRVRPDSYILSLGCGFSTYAQELSEGDYTWRDVDLPQVISLKEQLFEETFNYKLNAIDIYDIEQKNKHFHTKDLHNLGWPDLVICEGSLMYIGKMKAKELLVGHTHMIFDVLGSDRQKPLGPFHKWKYKFNEFDLNITNKYAIDTAYEDSWLLEINGEQ